MKKGKAAKLGLVTLFSTLTLGTFMVQNSTQIEAAPLGTELQYYLNDPTPAPSKFLNIWNTNGYDLQPDPVYNVQVGDKDKMMYTDAARSVWTVLGGVFDAPHYRWYKSDDGRTWSEVPEWQNGHRKNMPIDTSTEGTTWYQQDTQYWNYLTGWFAKTHIYSNISQVNVLKNNIDADSVNVTTDNSYLYNISDKLMNVTYAHATVNPTYATGKITWSTNHPELVTVDSDTGKITANSKGANGRATIIATYTGSNEKSPKIVTGKTYVTVGGGLVNQKARVGGTATFKLQGNTDDFYGYWDDNNIAVEWYTKKDGAKDSTEKLVASTSNLYYTTNALTSDDRENMYRAKIIMRKGTKQMTLTTNWAALTIL
ncbi:hypothetical protein [Companilactobacillus insicii]|uniref:hypothetical protein n=1 Tax=Companilactobacillus insicii TaxID=1732567 RepID=UPI000F78DD5F|nr:hypothetical protein [Companilactobacillus insicii]